MSGRIVGFFREFVLVFSIIALILGLIIFSMSLIHYFFQDMQPEFIKNLQDWNFYLMVVGFILLVAGIYYLYSYLRNKKFILDEIKTNKRSELLKKHAELKNTARHMPSKYQKMLKDKEKELKIK